VYYPVSANLTWDTANAKLQEMKVKKNQQVIKGDVLAVFEIATSEAQQTELQLQLQRKNEEFAKGKTTRLTAIQTAKTNLAEQSSLQRKIAELELAKLEIAYEQYVYQTEREIATLQERVDRFLKTQTDTVLLAPFDGVVESVASVREGEKVKVGQVILSMYSEEEVYLRVKKPKKPSIKILHYAACWLLIHQDYNYL
jgi:multidrug resistance efflux pump